MVALTAMMTAAVVEVVMVVVMVATEGKISLMQQITFKANSSIATVNIVMIVTEATAAEMTTVVTDTLLTATLLVLLVMIVAVVDTLTDTTVTWAAPLVMPLRLPTTRLHVVKVENTEVDFTTMTDTPVDKADG